MEFDPPQVDYHCTYILSRPHLWSLRRKDWPHHAMWRAFRAYFSRWMTKWSEPQFGHCSG